MQTDLAAVQRVQSRHPDLLVQEAGSASTSQVANSVLGQDFRKSEWTSIPLTINKQIIRDLVVTTIYIIGLGGFIWAFAFWNSRGKAPAGSDVVPTSAYGRPLVSKRA